MGPLGPKSREEVSAEEGDFGVRAGASKGRAAPALSPAARRGPCHRLQGPPWRAVREEHPNLWFIQGERQKESIKVILG